MALRRATDELLPIDIGDGDTISVKKEISKRDFNLLIAAMPQDVDTEKGLTPQAATDFQTALFEIFVSEWSMGSVPSVDEYLGLLREDAERIDAALMEHFSNITPTAPKGGRRKR